MRLLRVLTCLSVVVALTVALDAQTRPNFSGTWTLVPDKSTPPGPGHQTELTIRQSAEAITMTRVALIVSGPAAAGQPGERREFTAEIAYSLDGAEHPTPRPGSPAPAPTVSPVQQSTYRSIWTRDQLVIMTYETLRLPEEEVGRKRTSRVALSLDGDGQLIREQIILTDPTRDGPRQSAPVLVTSVYRKKS